MQETILTDGPGRGKRWRPCLGSGDMVRPRAPSPIPPLVARRAGSGPWLIVCEHAARDIPPVWGTLGLDAAAREAHIAWDPGALGLAAALARQLDAPLVAARVSRLVYDCNRPPDAPGAMATVGEHYRIPGNEGLSGAERAARARAVYLPFHAAVRREIVARLAHGIRPALVTVHSFTPTWFGVPRPTEIGLIHDADPGLATALAPALRARTPLRVDLNAPYSAADGVTHTLRLHALPYGLPNVMVEVRSDLLAPPGAAEALAEPFAAALRAAIAAPAAEAVP